MMLMPSLALVVASATHLNDDDVGCCVCLLFLKGGERSDSNSRRFVTVDEC
jgi:hypothetical protein